MLTICFWLYTHWKVTCFQNLQLVAKSCENPLRWWKAHETQFPIVGYLEILGIVGIQIDTKQIFFVTIILTSLYKHQLGIWNLNQLVIISKNWPNDPCFGCETLILKAKSFDDFEDIKVDFLDQIEEDLETNYIIMLSLLIS